MNIEDSPSIKRGLELADAINVLFQNEHMTVNQIHITLIGIVQSVAHRLNEITDGEGIKWLNNFIISVASKEGCEKMMEMITDMDEKELVKEKEGKVLH